MRSYRAIYRVVSAIPKGKVLTYKKVAVLSRVGNPRVVGFALHANRYPEHIPCHRVVRSDGVLAKGYAFGGQEAQKRKLEQEGVLFTEEYRVDLACSLATQ